MWPLLLIATAMNQYGPALINATVHYADGKIKTGGTFYLYVNEETEIVEVE